VAELSHFRRTCIRISFKIVVCVETNIAEGAGTCLQSGKQQETLGQFNIMQKFMEWVWVNQAAQWLKRHLLAIVGKAGPSPVIRTFC
jgi:hypothetical protein